MPSRINGNASVEIVNWDVVRSTLIAARTTTVPRLNGPAIAGTAIDSPNGAPRYGPVRYAGPETVNGSGPAPAPAVAVPICEAAGQVPCAACDSPHNGTPVRTPNSPGGVDSEIPERACCPSGRSTFNTNGVKAPAVVLVLPASEDGANGNGDGHGAPLPSKLV